MNTTKTIIAAFLSIAFSGFLNAGNHVTELPKKFDVVTLHTFLVSEPVPDKFFPKGESKEEYGYEFDVLKEIGGELSPSIEPGKKFSMPNGEDNSFTQRSWEKDYLDPTKYFGKLSNVFVYMYAVVQSPKEQDVWLHVGSNDGAKVWVNGNKVIDNEVKNGRTAEPSQDMVKISLKKGNNPILLKVDQLGGGWGAYVQIYSEKAHEKYLNRDDLKLERNTKVAEILDTKVICKEPGRYIGWPSLVKTSDGELMAVFSGDRDWHVCPWGVDQMIKSTDNGKTWSEPVTINNTPLDDRDAGIIQTKKGTLILSWFTSMAFDKKSFYVRHPDWERHRGKLSKETVDRWLGNWIRRSEDGGKTWGEPIRVQCTAPHGPIELKDGRILFVGIATLNGEKKIGVEVSKDDGKTWQMLSSIDIPDNVDIGPFSEPHVVEMPDGKLIAMIRYNPADRNKSFLWQSESTDGGQTWSVARQTNVYGYPPHLLLLKDGRLLVSYGVRRTPYGERACISKDGGKTWDVKNEIVLSVADNGDLGYPASVQLDDGSIITIYYQIDKPGEKTSLQMTHWRLK